jgi:Zn finger protein HypA/HybF involved in hydrogenase expression
MRSLPIHVWREFQLAVMLLSEESSLRDVLGVILSWIRRNHRYLAVDPFSSYGFDEFAHVNESLMPVDFSSFSPADIVHFKKVIFEYQAKEVEFIARFLRDTMEALITVEVDKQCPKCESDGMRVFMGKHNGLLAYQCNVCGHSHYIDGSKVELGGLEFANELNLRSVGLI